MTLTQYDKLGLSFERNAEGMVQIHAQNEALYYEGLGLAHAHDRGTQLLLMRILGRGEGSLYLEASDEMFDIDSFFRKMNWHGNLSQELGKLSAESKAFCLAYCEGVNQGLSQNPPLFLKLMGIKIAPWMIEDSLLLARMTGYLTLAQSQAELELFLVQCVQNGVSEPLLKALFPDGLEGVDTDLLKQVKLSERVIPEGVLNQKICPPMMASNNWVVAPQKSVSGGALLANDPHLEGNRLPNVWYEVGIHLGKKTHYGVSMPGLPGLLLGRTPDLAWGATYTFMDAVDSWVEHCRDGQYFYDGQWHDFKVRKEVIERKKKSPIHLTFYENSHGVLDGDPYDEGYYLSSQWSGSQSGAQSINALQEMLNAQSVSEGQALLGQLETSWNWVLSDLDGNIGYQMSGLSPRRREGWSGLYPVPGWLPENDWQGFVSPKDLPQAYNPPEGYLVTANQDLNHLGKANPINAPMGGYRAERIRDLLESKNKLSTQDMKDIQGDLFSLQAQACIKAWKHLLPDSAHGRLLKHWNCLYEPEQVEPWLFERIYQTLYKAVFGAVFGEDALDYILQHTGLWIDFYAQFDRVLLAEESIWFQGQTRDDLFRPLIASALNCEPQTWGSQQQFYLKHILLGGKLPLAFKVDHGPYSLAGGRATPHQGQLYRAGERFTSFMPTFRFVTDLSTSLVESCLLGGPSDSPWSKWYTSEVLDWLNMRYKKFDLERPSDGGV